MTSPQLFLASQSPRRKALLESAGFFPVVMAPDPTVDAEAIELPLAGEEPLPYVQRVATIKRDLAAARLPALNITPQPRPTDLILAADTTVALDDQIFGKPLDQDHAIAMLRALSGKTHRVLTAISICTVAGRHPQTAVVSANVQFAPLTDAWIKAYVASGEPMDKAGAYAIQGQAGAMIPAISVSYTAIVGLPLYETVQMIQAASATTS
jgi:septum formation protein